MLAGARVYPVGPRCALPGPVTQPRSRKDPIYRRRAHVCCPLLAQLPTRTSETQLSAAARGQRGEPCGSGRGDPRAACYTRHPITKQRRRRGSWLPLASAPDGACSVPQYLHLLAAAGRSSDKHAGQVFVGPGSPNTVTPRLAEMRL